MRWRGDRHKRRLHPRGDDQRDGMRGSIKRPDEQASAEAALALPFLASTQASSPFENDRIDPSLDDSLALIDQLTQDLVALTDEAILTHAANRDLDPVVTPPSP